MRDDQPSFAGLETVLDLDVFFDEHQTGGFDPRSPYVERFWLPLLGPSTLLLVRQLVYRVEDGEREVDLRTVAGALGLGDVGGRRGAFVRTLGRALDFDMIRLHEPATLAVRRLVPRLRPRQVEHLPEQLRSLHERLADTAGAPSNGPFGTDFAAPAGRVAPSRKALASGPFPSGPRGRARRG